jgi:FkbM family methyltransferase
MKKILKAVYKNMPFKQQMFSVVRKLFTLPDAISKHLYFDGTVDFKVNGKTVTMNQKGYDVENTLFWRGTAGCWEKVSVGLWLELCKDANNILDIGANTGAYALIAKTMNEKASVFAFEPMEKIYKRLKANVDLNDLDIKCMPYALSNFDGKAKVFPESEDHIYSVTVNQNRSDSSIPVFESEIEVKTLQKFIAENGIKGIDLMKIDVETHEPEVLEGMGHFLSQWKPTLLIEILDLEVARKVQEYTSNLGYLYFNIDEDGGIEQTQNLTISKYYNFLICSADIAKKLKLTN